MVKGHEDRYDIFDELKNMRLSVEDRLDILALIVKVPHLLSSFRSNESGAIKFGGLTLFA